VPEREPHNWPELAAAYNKRDYPLAIGIGSMIGTPRNWIGFDNIAMMVYDDPGLLEEIVETLCTLVCATLERVLCDVEFDFGSGWEDICFNSGPIVGVPFMRDVVAPRYKRITSLLNKHGCHVAWTDTDGNVMPVVDSFLAGGINCLFPVEVHAGSDPVAIRRRWPGIRMQGGICKMRLAEGPAAIRAELERLAPFVREGGFLPGVDHRVPANITLANYQYYMKMKRELFGVGGTPEYDESRIG
jgi:uroporphyrinogen decarboxylase